MNETVLSRETLHDWGQLVRAEYLEMPGLALTPPQARKLWGLDDATCDVLLDQLVDDRFLRKTPENRYVRADVDR